MTIDQLNLTWEKILDKLSVDIDEILFRLCFKDKTKLVYVTDNTAFILVSGQMSKGYIEQNCDANLKAAMTLYIKPDMNYTLIVGNLDLAESYTQNLHETVEKNVDNVDNLKTDYNKPVEKTDVQKNKKSESYPQENKNKDVIKDYNLNPKYVFEEFVIGKNNQFAYAAAKSVAEGDENSYNPLFIYGDVGLGKTHLMQAIANKMIENNPDANVVYITSEKFVNEFINAIQNSKNVEFREKYRPVDILLIDDIQFFANKKETQEEFFHTFNELYQNNKKIILSSDRHPREINPLEERLKSRFEQGLIADISAPDYETRVAILNKKLKLENREISYDVVEYIARNINSNIRELEGALNRVLAYSNMMNLEINIDTAKIALENIIREDKNKTVDINSIKEIVCSYYSIKKSDLNSKRKSRNISYPRQIIMYLCRELIPTITLSQIGEEFGGKDHTTVIHACNKIAKEMEENKKLKINIEKMIEDINNL